MRKHTPGPWTAHARTVTAPETEDRLEMHVQINGNNREDNKANARLIAAAPDLLAALQTAEMAMLGYTVRNEVLVKALADVRAAIVKAAGAAS